MAKIEGFKSEAPRTGFPMLPAGTYVAGIKNVKVDGSGHDRQIVLRLDIIEGEHTGYYTKRYDHDSKAGGNYEVRYKGDFRIQIPDAANTNRQHPEWDLKKLNNSVWAIEQSNPGFRWDGDTDTVGEFKGKVVGINVREATFNGNRFTQIGKLEVAEDVRRGIVQTMSPRTDGSVLPAEAPAADPSGFTPVEVEELPF